MSLRRSVTLSFLILAALIVAGVTGVLFFQTRNFLLGNMIQDSCSISKLAAPHIEELFLTSGESAVPTFLHSLSQQSMQISGGFVEANGTVLATSLASGVPEALLHLPPLPASSPPQVTPLRSNSGELLLAVRRPLDLPLPTTLVLVVSTNATDTHMRRLVPFFGVVFFAFLLFAALLSHQLAGGISSQVQELTDILILSEQNQRQRAEKLSQAIGYLQKLLEATERQDSLGVRFENPNLETCWEKKHCRKEDCPAFGLVGQRCWQIAGRHCPGNDPACRGKGCDTCEVFCKTTGDPILQIGEIFNNMMARLQGHQKSETDALERAQRLALQADGANRAKTVFLATMSHEMRTPLSGITGMADLLFSTPLNHEQLNYTETIKSSADHLLSVMNDVLDFSRIEAGKLELEYQDFDLLSLIEETCAAMTPQLQEKPFLLSFQPRNTLPEIVSGDRNRFRQVLINLIGNALKFTKTGEIEIQVEHVSETDLNILLRFAVRDTGIGIPSEEIPRLFNLYEQGDLTFSRRFGGSGLGLAISKRLVEMMGGEMSAESFPGRGSTFSFTVLFHKTSARLPTPAFPPSFTNHPVLLICRNRSMEKMVTWQLRNSGLTVEHSLTEKDNARPSLSCLLIEIPPDDPEIWKFLHRIRQDKALKDVPLFGLYGHGCPPPRAPEALSSLTLIGLPTRRSYLIQALSGMPISECLPTKPITPANNLNGKAVTAARAERILVVDDNPVNAQVAKRILEKAGYQVQEAQNGRIAVEAVVRGAFDLIFMDGQMPELDGFAATSQIRRMTQLRQPVIIGLTALASKGDRDRCLAAGMDDYLPKPITAQVILERVEHFLHAQNQAPRMEPRTAPPAPPSTESPSEGRLIDLALVLANLDKDAAAFQQVISIFRQSTEGHLTTLEGAIADRDPQAFRAAHSIKGSALDLGASGLSERAQRLEKLCRENRFDEAIYALADLKQHWVNVCAALPENPGSDVG